MTKIKTAAKTSAQINMAAIVAAASGVAPAAAVKAEAAAPEVDSGVSTEPTVTAKEAPILAAIAQAKAFANVTSLSSVKGVDAKSVPGIVASLGKKGFVATEPSFMGTLYVATATGKEAAALLS